MHMKKKRSQSMKYDKNFRNKTSKVLSDGNNLTIKFKKRM